MSINRRIENRIDRQIIAQVSGENVVQIWAEDFITGPLPSGGTLYYGPVADKSKMKAWEETESANGFFLVKNAIPGMYYYFAGNSGLLNIYYV